MPLPPLHASYWMDSTQSTDFPCLDEDREADVVVVGGGIAGLCTAWELVRAGRGVVLLEAGRIASGVTGHTTAKLSCLHSLIYARLRAASGADAARWYATSQREAIDRVFRLVEDLGVDCELETADSYTYAVTPDTAARVREEAEAARQAGLPASFVTRTELPFPVAGAVRVADQATFHPRRFLLALAADLVARGGRIFEGSRVTGLREGEPCRVTTEPGPAVTAADVVVATHYPVFNRALSFARLEPRRELVIAGPVPSDRAPAGMYLTPDQNTRSVRTAPYGAGQRLLIVTGEHFGPGTGRVRERQERLTAWAREHFPDLVPTYQWAAQDNATTDGLPHVGPFHPRARHVHVATGFGGWGMSNGVMAGGLLAAHLTGRELPPWASLYDPRRLHPVREAPALLGLQASVARHFVGDRLPGATTDSVARIAPGGGAVVRCGGRHLAVHRDDLGGLHAVQARCTHLGCLVRFNDAERTWECPCHGSRFDVEGHVLQGPAVRPLRPEPVRDDPRTDPGTDAGTPPH
ncbi:[Fe-S]-binding protein [Wenjunlia vitaminophila]|uniref:[Fe-S]-binding protein n=1 Tax=Wenjunlia vitaminophila TaxID=76728 RepID=A0A0T6LWT0_WENVI|nr:FAD-dependent oxidoreductase [Wenjunlia vitaminophila]KRV50518.1 [Fe-S]-binding protein [Wenjunlia vitaminophila]